jgi:hypothetical protein
MKTNLKVAAFYFLTVIFGGCVPSIHPLFTSKQAVFDANFVGTWLPQDSNEIWVLKQNGMGYEGFYIDNDSKTGKFAVSLCQLQNNMFLDIYPKEMNSAENAFYKIHFTATHSFAWVCLTKDSLELRVMNPESLDKLLKAEPNAVKHERLEHGDIVLTASTEELQKFMIKYGTDEKLELFGKPKKACKLHRGNAN